MGAMSEKTRKVWCSGKEGGCEAEAVGELAYMRRIGGPGQPWIEWARDSLCEYHAYRHRKAAAPDQDRHRFGWAVPFGHYQGQVVHQLAYWNPHWKKSAALKLAETA